MRKFISVHGLLALRVLVLDSYREKSYSCDLYKVKRSFSIVVIINEHFRHFRKAHTIDVSKFYITLQG